MSCGWALTFGDVGVGVAAVLGHAVAGEVLGFVGVEVDGVVVEDVEELLEGFHDEDESDEKREALLRETRDVLHLRPTTTQHASNEGREGVRREGFLTHQSAEVERNHDEQDRCHPDSNPEAERQIVPFIRTTQQQQKQT